MRKAKHADLEQAILSLVGRSDYRPVKPRLLAQQLQLPKDSAPEVKQTVKKLVSQGQLAYGPGRVIVPVDVANAQTNRVVGVFRRMEGGYGFVRPNTAAQTDSETPDVYIPSRRGSDASTGDVVMVHLKPRCDGKHPGPRGEIVKIIRRQSHEFVGTYYESGGSGYVEIDGTLFSRSILVGDPGASRVQPDEKVVIDMIRFPSHFREGEGVIIEVLGPSGKPGVDTLSILREFGLPEDFAEDALEEARRQADLFDESIPAGRFDATGLTVLTIDPVDARDFDDAISLERLETGHWLLGVHIADVSHFVRPKTALDREAFTRATSVYLPDRVIPMLPELISNGLASLQPGKVRYTKTAFIEFTAEGIPVSTEFHAAAIKSSKRLAYEQVDQFLEDPKPWRRKLGVKVHDLLGRMHELAMILRRRRFQRGALELSMPELKVELDKQGRVTGAHVVENTESHQIIEEFMLAANEAVAQYFAGEQLHFLRRVHKAPAPRKLRALTEFVTELGFQTENLESRFELQKLLDQVKGRPEQHAVNYAVLRSLQRAVYSPQDEGHYALASECYCHFTSPIRRYPDLTVHRLLEQLLASKPPENDFDELATVGEHCSEREERAEAAERELTKLKLLNYLSGRIGEEMDAVVTGVQSFGVFVRGVELPAEGLIHVSSLGEDDYRFDRATHTLAGFRSGNVFRLGDLLRVSVFRVDVDRRELDFRLVRRKRRPALPEEPATKSKKSKRKKPASEGQAKGRVKKVKKVVAREKTVKKKRRR